MSNTKGGLVDMGGWNSWNVYADTALVEEFPTHSPVLKADGKPYQYQPKPPVGFDLSKKPKE